MIEQKLKTYRLNQKEYDRICTLLGREPKGVEWALFSALWSEHCSYKSSKVHLKALFNKSPRVLQSFGENAGVLDLGQGERIAFKMESHNHPSFIEPYQGAATGVGGILRDVFTMGARPIALANYLCFGEPSAPRMTALVDGVVRGISGYGNCVGVPNLSGQTEFHKSYNNNVLVNAFALGLFRPGEPIALSQAQGVGNSVVYVGAKTGRDGVHGASMASESFGEDSESKRPTVQIGDPFFEKLLIESCIEAIQSGLVVAIQDMGAAGLTSSSFEMAAKGGVGLTIDLAKVPLRDSSLTPEDILLSESQERMLLICEPKNFAALAKIFERWNLDSAVIGEVTGTQKVRLLWGQELLTEIDPRLLVDEAPLHTRDFSEWVSRNFVDCEGDIELPKVEDPNQELLGLLKSEQGCSRSWIYEQYDTRVGARTASGCEANIGVLRLPDSGRGLGIVLGCRPHVMRADAKIGGMDSIVAPALELAVKGFEVLGVTDCLNFGNPERNEIMSEFVASLRAMSAVCEELQAPIISGNVSFYNETQGQNITSTPATGLVGLRASVDNIPADHFTRVGEDIFELRLPLATLGGLFQEKKGLKQSFTGQAEIHLAAQFVKLCLALSQNVRLHTAQVVGKFGLGYSLARMSLGGVGAEVKLEGSPRELFLEPLYSVLVVPEDTKTFEHWLKIHGHIKGLLVRKIGVTHLHRLSIDGSVDLKIEELKSAYNSGWGATFEELA